MGLHVYLGKCLLTQQTMSVWAHFELVTQYFTVTWYNVDTSHTCLCAAADCDIQAVYGTTCFCVLSKRHVMQFTRWSDGMLSLPLIKRRRSQTCPVAQGDFCLKVFHSGGHRVYLLKYWTHFEVLVLHLIISIHSYSYFDSTTIPQGNVFIFTPLHLFKLKLLYSFRLIIQNMLTNFKIKLNWSQIHKLPSPV